MGTPSYMAPEQAAGRVQDIAPATDVYALGAILYEMLTGRPPFREASIVETLDKVRTQEPAPPSRLQSRVPRDLETICLKCLAKEPKRHYNSALALAQDLESFQAGESIKARPEGAAGKLWRKLRRRPLTYASFLGLLVLATLAVGYFAFKANVSDSRSRESIRLLSAIEAGSEAPDWNAEHLETLDALIAELERVAPEQAAGARERLHKRFADAIRASFSKAVLPPGEVPGIVANLDLLAARHPELEGALRKDLTARLATLQRVINLKPPFTAPDSDAPGEILPNNVSVDATGKRSRGAPRVLTNIPCQGNVELKAVFSLWESAPRVALVLNAGAEAPAYIKFAGAPCSWSEPAVTPRFPLS